MSTAEGENQNIYKIKMHRWRMAFFGLVILLAGVAIGASLALIGTWRFQERPAGPEQIANRMVKRLWQDLDLSPEQRQQIEPIVRRHMDKLDEIRRDARPLIESQMQQMKAEVSDILNDEQKARWDRMLTRLPLDVPDRPARQGFGHGPGPGPQRPMGPGPERDGTF